MKKPYRIGLGFVAFFATHFLAFIFCGLFFNTQPRLGLLSVLSSIAFLITYLLMGIKKETEHPTKAPYDTLGHNAPENSVPSWLVMSLVVTVLSMASVLDTGWGRAAIGSATETRYSKHQDTVSQRSRGEQTIDLILSRHPVLNNANSRRTIQFVEAFDRYRRDNLTVSRAMLSAEREVFGRGRR